MGYTTEFTGKVFINPPLNDAERAYLKKFAETRRMQVKEGPYFVDQPGFMGQDGGPNVINFNAPPLGQPGLWCQWGPTEDGTALQWDGGEKFYAADQWMRYLIDHFLKPGAIASLGRGDQFRDFTFDHTVNGMIHAQGEDVEDRWTLIVLDNMVSKVDGHRGSPTLNPPPGRITTSSRRPVMIDAD